MKLRQYLHIRNTWKQALWFNLGAVLLILLSAEGVCRWLEVRESRAMKRIRTEQVYEVIPDDLVGVRLKPATRRVSRKYADKQLVYKAVVTTDANGLRITPACKPGCDSAVLFFGDSFTYGEGVDDTATMPYRVGLRCTDQYKVLNFAVHGYGPHQMLSLIEHGRVEGVVDKSVSCVVYQAIYPEHVHRLMGHYDWNAHSPRYIMQDNGIPRFMGPFDSNPPVLMERIVGSTALGRRILNYTALPEDDDKDLFVAMVIRSRDLLRQQWPDARFHLLVWDWTEGADSLWFDQLGASGIRIHYIRNILPDGSKYNPAYRIGPDDKHPNARTQQLIADYVTSQILGIREP